MSAPYLHLSNFPISLNTEWIPVSPWLGPSRCPKIGCTILLLAFRSLHKMQIHCRECIESLISMAELFRRGCSSQEWISLPSLPCWRRDLPEGERSLLASTRAKAKISWIWVEMAFSRRARRSWSAILGLKAESAWILSGNLCSTSDGGESAVRKPPGDFRFDRFPWFSWEAGGLLAKGEGQRREVTPRSSSLVPAASMHATRQSPCPPRAGEPPGPTHKNQYHYI